MSDAYPIDGPQLAERHNFAAKLYTAANAAANEVEALLTTGVPLPTEDQEGAVQVTQPVRAGATVERFRQMMQVDASTKWRVMPLRAGQEEQAACTHLERWWGGFERQHQWHTKRNYKRDAIWWFLAFGRVYPEARFRQDWQNIPGRVPIDILVDDPRTIYPVKGRDGFLWYTKQYPIYRREAERQLEGLREIGLKVGETGWLSQVKQDARVCAVEYWDENWYCLGMSPQPAAATPETIRPYYVLANEHKLGFVPLAEGLCLDTPLASAEWASQSVIGPVVSHLKQIYILASKMATGVNLFYYPLMYYVSATGQVVIYDPNNPKQLQPLPAGSEVKIIPVQVNAQVLQQLMSFLMSDVNLRTLPETAWGSEPQSLQSGFAVAQVLAQVASAVQDKAPAFAQALAWNAGHVLRIAEHIAGGSGINLKVPADFDE